MEFYILLFFGSKIYQQAPPIPASFETSNGSTLYTRADIEEGQNIWQSLDGMQQGSIWGHGSYLAPDWSADWLHREALALLALIAHLTGIDSRETLLRSAQVGHNFESFIIEEIIKGIQASKVTRWDYYYYRTKNGAEIDLILEGSFGLLPIEIKFGQKTTLKQLTSLQQFVKRHDLPFGIVINNSTEVRRLSEEIIPGN